MLSEPPRCRPVPVLALKGADSPRGLDRGHSPGHASPPGARSTGGGWSLPASWPDPNSLRQVDPDHDERYRGGWSLPASWPDPNSLRQVDPDHDERYRGGSPDHRVALLLAGRTGSPTEVGIEPTAIVCVRRAREGA